MMLLPFCSSLDTVSCIFSVHKSLSLSDLALRRRVCRPPSSGARLEKGGVTTTTNIPCSENKRCLQLKLPSLVAVTGETIPSHGHYSVTWVWFSSRRFEDLEPSFSTALEFKHALHKGRCKDGACFQCSFVFQWRGFECSH